MGILLIITEPPVVDLKASINKKGLSVTFSGEITSSSPLKQVIWLKDDEAINMSDKTKYSSLQSIGNNQELNMFSVDKFDDGKYQLLAENIAGKGKSKPFVLKIEKGMLHHLLVIATTFPLLDNLNRYIITLYNLTLQIVIDQT